MNPLNPTQNPDLDLPLLFASQPLERAPAAMLLIHGRGATAESILTLAASLNQPRFAYLAPQAPNQSWYPQRFLAPLASNEPELSASLEIIAKVLAYSAQAGIPVEHTILLGFSQGACLVLEYAVRNPRRYGGIVGLSGALIGPLDTPRSQAGRLMGTPVFLGCGDRDDHIPIERVHHAAEVIEQLGGAMTTRIYSGMGHTINQNETNMIRSMMSALIEA